MEREGGVGLGHVKESLLLHHFFLASLSMQSLLLLLSPSPFPSPYNLGLGLMEQEEQGLGLGRSDVAGGIAWRENKGSRKSVPITQDCATSSCWFSLSVVPT